MTKYYYTDPLAAAYMAKHFGMRLDYVTDNMIMQNAGHMALDVAENCDGRFYIHPDSLHLLEPQTGDLIEVDLFAGRGNECFIHNSSWQCHTNKWEFHRITQRNDKPFFWPEKE